MKILDHLASATLSFVILTANAFLPASAQSGPTPQEQMACRSDAGKFCAEHVGKPPQMNACLRANKAKLSDSCRRGIPRRVITSAKKCISSADSCLARHARPCAGHPRLDGPSARKTWMAGTSPAMTE